MSQSTQDLSAAGRPDRTVDELLALGRSRLAERDFSGAETAFRDATQLDCGRAAAWLELGEALRELGRWQEAAAAYETASRLDAGVLAVQVGLAIALVNLGQAEAALAACRSALALDSNAPSAHRALALAQLRAGNFAGAEGAARHALELAPGSPEGQSTLALVLMIQGRLDEADALFAASIDAKPTVAETLTNRATLLARQGKDVMAMREAARAIKLKPFQPGPYMLLGTLMRRAGRIVEAVVAFDQVIRLAPGQFDARVNLADTLRAAGQLNEAVAVCRAGLARDGNHVGLLNNLGMAHYEQGDIVQARAAFDRALELAPGQPEVENNLARLHQATGRLDEALAGLRRALAGRPDDIGIAENLVAALCETGRMDDAREAAEVAVRLLGDVPESTAPVLCHLARLYDGPNGTGPGQRATAEAVMRTLIVLAPDHADAWQQTAAMWLRIGERRRALPYARRAARLMPENARAWAIFAQSVRGFEPAEADGAMRADLLDALAHPSTENGHLVVPILALVRHNPAMQRLRAAVFSADPDTAVAHLLTDATMRPLADDTLFCRLLETTVIADGEIERILTVLRRVLLGQWRAGGITMLDNLAWLPLLCALADQCFLNEYVYDVTAAEAALVGEFSAALSAAAERKEAPIAAHVALLGAYQPLHREAYGGMLVAYSKWPQPIVELLMRQVREPVTEQVLAGGIDRLTPIADAVSCAVRAQYEENPYPRWRDADMLDAPLAAPQVIRAILPQVTLTGECWTSPEVLVAGCGSGRESVWAANQIAGARVLAVDLSLASLSYALRQTRKFGMTAITYAQADILALGTLDRRFDIIQSVGVLHHMGDPLAGWRVLSGLLKPHGVMKIGLYSAVARRAVTAARSLIAERGYQPTLDGIRRVRRDIRALPDDHPVKPMVWSPDFYNVSACRDLMFHVQEHQVTLPTIAGWLDALDLEFLGFQHEDPAVRRRYQERFPEDAEMTSLASWDRFEAENPDTFAGLYQFWVRRRQTVGGVQP